MDQQSTSLDEHSTEELIGVVLRESAKASAELRSATNDLQKAHKRLSFVLLLANRLKERENINGFETSSNKT